MRHNSISSYRFDITALVFCFGTLILALVIGHFHVVGFFGVETDFYGAYAKQAENIIAGRPYTFRHNPPGYMLLLAAVSFFTGDLFVAGKIISAISTALFGWVIYLLFSALFGKRIALATVILSLFSLFPYSFLAATDILGALLIILPIWIILRKTVPTLTTSFLVGILSGLSYLVRYNALFVIIGIAFSLLFINLNRERLQRRLAMVGIFVCGILIITLPWLIINWQTNGSPFASTAYLQIAAHFYHPRGDTHGTSLREVSSEFKSLSQVVLHNPALVIRKYLKDVLFHNIKLLASKGLGFPAYLFAGAGFILLLRDLSRKRLSFLLINLLGFLLLGLVGFYLRYYFFLFPFLFLTVAYFLFHQNIFTNLGRLPFSGISVSWFIMVIIAFFLCIGSYKMVKSQIAKEPRYLLQIAHFLKNRSSPDDIIIVRKPHLAYLSGLKSCFPLAETTNQYLKRAREERARYLVYSDLEAAYWPGLKSFADPRVVPKSFKLIYQHKQSNTLIYEIDT